MTVPDRDDGQPDARLIAALAAEDGSPTARGEIWAALATARVFLPLAAQRHGPTGSAADLSLVLIGSASGARALPAFTDGHAVQGWRPEARPVPVSGPQACRTAIDEGAQALLLDPAGALLAITGPDLSELAAGRVPVSGAGLSTRRVRGDFLSQPGLGNHASQDAMAESPRAWAPIPETPLAALGRALDDEPEVADARLLLGPDGPVVGLVLPDPLSADPARLAGLAERVRTRLGHNLPPAGLDLTVVASEGPGQSVPLARRPPAPDSQPRDRASPSSGSRRRWRR